MKQKGWWLWPAALLIYTMVIFGHSMMPAVQSSAESGYVPVSYTHLDVYKRQEMSWRTMGFIP